MCGGCVLAGLQYHEDSIQSSEAIFQRLKEGLLQIINPTHRRLRCPPPPLPRRRLRRRLSPSLLLWAGGRGAAGPAEPRTWARTSSWRSRSWPPAC